jgi:hypothetical protein
VVDNVLVGSRPRFAEFKRDGSELWVSSEIAGTVSVIDPAQHTVTGKITFDIPGMRREAIQPVGIGMTRDGKTAFIALGPANRIAIVDGTSHQVTKYLLVGWRARHGFLHWTRNTLVTAVFRRPIRVAAQKAIKTTRLASCPASRAAMTESLPPFATSSTEAAHPGRIACLTIDRLSYSWLLTALIDRRLCGLPSASFTALLLNGVARAPCSSLVTRRSAYRPGARTLWRHQPRAEKPCGSWAGVPAAR